MHDRRLLWVFGGFVGALLLLCGPSGHAMIAIGDDGGGGGYTSCTPDVDGNIQCCAPSDPGYPDSCSDIQTNQEDDNTNQCVGECGSGCSFINCGAGAACAAHDSCTTQYGLYAWQCDAIFPAAAVQLIACQAERAITNVVGFVKHMVTGVVKSVAHFFSHIFN